MSLFTDASLVMVPSGIKTSKVYSVVPTDGTGDLDFTRSNDTATRVAPDGLIERVRTNVAFPSADFTTGWSVYAGAVTANTATNPIDGLTTADTFTAATSAGLTGIERGFIVSSGEVTASVYFKYTNNQSVYVSIYDTSYKRAYFDIQNGVLGSVPSGATSAITSVGDGWYRCSITTTSTTTLTYHTFGTEYPTLGGESFYAFGAQMENGVLTEYIPTTITTVSTGPVANIGRLDYSGGATCPSLLLERSTTNLVPYSEAISQWVLAAATLTSNDAISPDGYQNADKIVTSAAGCDVKYPSVNVLASTTYTASFWVKLTSGTGLQTRFYDNTNGANIEYYLYDSDLTIGEWSRVTRTFTTPAGCTNIQVWYLAASSSSSVTAHFWGYQLEQASYATSYIPTLSAAVTRGADSCYKTGISSLIGTEGTIYLEADIQKYNESGFYVSISAGFALGTAIYLYQPSSGILQLLIRNAGNPDASISILSANWTAGFNKVAIAYTSTTAEIFVNGVSKGTTSFTLAPTCSLFTMAARPDVLGTLVGSGQYNQALLFTTRLTNAQLAELTTL